MKHRTFGRTARTRLVCAAAAAGVGCAQDVAVDSAAGRVAPFGELEGIALGMRGQELVARRAGVRVAGYVGYGEEVGTYHIAYVLPGSWSEEQAPTGRARLQKVIATRRLPDAADADSAWHARRHEVGAALGAAPTCYRLGWPVGEAWLAVWTRDGADVSVLGQPAFDSLRSPTPPSVRTGVMPAGQALEDAGGTSQEAPCEAVGAPSG